MSATIHNLTTARAARRKPPMVFDTDADALLFVAEHLDRMRSETRETLLVPSEPLALTLDQLAAVVNAVRDLYTRDERGSR